MERNGLRITALSNGHDAPSPAASRSDCLFQRAKFVEREWETGVVAILDMRAPEPVRQHQTLFGLNIVASEDKAEFVKGRGLSMVRIGFQIGGFRIVSRSQKRPRILRGIRLCFCGVDGAGCVLPAEEALNPLSARIDDVTRQLA